MTFIRFRRVLPSCVALFPIVLTGIKSLGASPIVQSFDRTGNGVTFRLSTGTLRVELCSDRVVHVLASATEDLPKAATPTVIGPCNESSFQIDQSAASIILKTKSIQARVDRNTGALQFLSPDGTLILAERADGGRSITPIQINGTPSFRVQQQFLSSPDEALYGLGQHQEGFFNLRGIPLRLLQANTNISIPVLLSTKGYGLLWNNPSMTDFNVAEQPVKINADTGEGTFKSGDSGEYGFLLSGNLRDRLRLTVDGKAIIDLASMWVPDSAGAKIALKANTEYKISVQTGGDAKLFVRPPSNITAFLSEAGNAVDYYLLYGPQLNEVVREYRDLTGAVPLLPRWAYGFWQCRERYSSQQQILDTAAEFRKRKIPVDVIVQDWRYWGKYGWNAMRFDEQDYPNPQQMVTQLHQEQIHLVASVWPKLGSETAVDQVMRKDHLILPSIAGKVDPGEETGKDDWVDLFNPEAQKLFWSEMNHGLFHDGNGGLDGWWLDASEPEFDQLKDITTHLGPGEFVRNMYPLYETTAVYKGQRATTDQKRVVILSRSAFTGQQRNGAISWSGDVTANWETLRRQIPAGLSFSISGFPYWTTDIGGFFRPDDQYTSSSYHELLIRWFEFGTFCPIFRIHGFRSETEMWKYGPEVEQVLREYDSLRYRLLPYIYSAAWGITSRGETMMRALPLAFPNQPKLNNIQDQFLFGPSLLINPVVNKGAIQRELYLPSGEDWVDFWTGHKEHGGATINAAAPLSRIPIYVKQGSILALGPLAQSAEDSEGPLEVRVYPGKDADFELYEDSGDGYEYEHGRRATIPIHWDDHRELLTIGSTIGSFQSMRKRRIFQVVRVRVDHGTGTLEGENPDRELEYLGHKITLRLPSSR